MPEETHSIHRTGDGIPVRLGPAREGRRAQYFDSRYLSFLHRAGQDQSESGGDSQEGRGLCRFGVQLGLLARDHIGNDQVAELQAKFGVHRRSSDPGGA